MRAKSLKQRCPALCKEYVIATKPDVQGVVQPAHKIPYVLQPRLKEYLQKLADNDIIADADKPTEWVHNIVVIEKTSSCVSA